MGTIDLYMVSFADVLGTSSTGFCIANRPFRFYLMHLYTLHVSGYFMVLSPCEQQKQKSVFWLRSLVTNPGRHLDQEVVWWWSGLGIDQFV
jgi:hypothetical protein